MLEQHETIAVLGKGSTVTIDVHHDGLGERPGPRWFLVHAQTGRERIAQINLERQSYNVFMPWMWKSIRHARKIRTERRAFFPGYLFVSLDLGTQRWRPIDGTIGVLRIVKDGSQPLTAPVGLVESLLNMVADDGALSLTPADVAEGDTVEIVQGPFCDQWGIVQALSDSGRISVLIDMMQQKIPVTLKPEDVRVTKRSA